MSGGYEDDEDYGDVIIYTGHGGNDIGSRRQIANQQMTRHNVALARNAITGTPVRVIRGFRLDSIYAPDAGYRYDGLYRVDNYWQEKGLSGFIVWRYRLVKLSAEPSPENTKLLAKEERAPYAAGNPKPKRVEVTTQRVVRTTAVAESVKGMYGYACQRCGTKIVTSAGPYAEAAHIRPLGRPHDGPDVTSNVLCLCPNCHTEFDYGLWAIADDLSLVGSAGKLNVLSVHGLDMQHLAYRRQMSGFES